MTAGRLLLFLSLLVNVILVAACFELLKQAKKHYTDYRHFRSLEIGTSEATSATPADNSIVLFGDSRIETWHPKPYSDKYTFINAGVTGETTTEMRRRFERDVVSLQPDYVLIQAGVNDLTASVTKGIEQPDQLVNTMQDNLEYFIKTLEQQDIDVIVTSILPALHLNTLRKIFWHDRLTDEINLANEKLKHTAESNNAEWLDLDPYFLDDSGNPQSDIYYDALHITHEGYDVLNTVVKEFTDTL